MCENGRHAYTYQWVVINGEKKHVLQCVNTGCGHIQGG